MRWFLFSFVFPFFFFFLVAIFFFALLGICAFVLHRIRCKAGHKKHSNAVMLKRAFIWWKRRRKKPSRLPFFGSCKVEKRDGGGSVWRSICDDHKKENHIQRYASWKDKKHKWQNIFLFSHFRCAVADMFSWKHVFAESRFVLYYYFLFFFFQFVLFSYCCFLLSKFLKRLKSA